jgi:hypothetical protein
LKHTAGSSLWWDVPAAFHTILTDEHGELTLSRLAAAAAAAACLGPAEGGHCQLFGTLLMRCRCCLLMQLLRIPWLSRSAIPGSSRAPDILAASPSASGSHANRVNRGRGVNHVAALLPIQRTESPAHIAARAIDCHPACPAATYDDGVLMRRHPPDDEGCGNGDEPA